MAARFRWVERAEHPARQRARASLRIQLPEPQAQAHLPPLGICAHPSTHLQPAHKAPPPSLLWQCRHAAPLLARILQQQLLGACWSGRGGGQGAGRVGRTGGRRLVSGGLGWGHHAVEARCQPGASRLQQASMQAGAQEGSRRGPLLIPAAPHPIPPHSPACARGSGSCSSSSCSRCCCTFRPPPNTCCSAAAVSSSLTPRWCSSCTREVGGWERCWQPGSGGEEASDGCRTGSLQGSVQHRQQQAGLQA